MTSYLSVIVLGVNSPAGYFDPLGLAKDQETFDQYRASELKHGRVAQLAVIGYIVPEIFKVYWLNIVIVLI